MRVQIQDVAEACGVSTATVSRVFNRRQNVREETRRHVLDVALRMGYSPKLMARKDCLAVVVEGYEQIGRGAYGTSLLAAITKHVALRDYRLEIQTVADLPVLRKKFYRGVVSTLYRSESLAALQDVADLPIVTVNAAIPGAAVVRSDDTQGMRLAVQHLVEHGHRRIALLAQDSGSQNAQRRVAAFRAAMGAIDCSVEDALVAPGGDGDSAVESLANVLRRGASAIIASGEHRGPMVAYAAQVLGVTIPGQLSLIAFERTDISRFSWPPQTTLAQDFDGLGRECARVLSELEETSDDRTNPPVVELPYRLIERESVAAPGTP